MEKSHILEIAKKLEERTDYYKAGEFLRDMGLSEEAGQHYENIARKTPSLSRSASLLNIAATCYFDAGNYEKAKELVYLADDYREKERQKIEKNLKENKPIKNLLRKLFNTF